MVQQMSARTSRRRPARPSGRARGRVARGARRAGAGAARSRSPSSPASSLTDVFPAIDPSDETYSFAGSNTLATQITNGAPADVFASANTTIPAALYAQGLVEKPVNFTRNTLVIVVPKSNPAGINDIYDLTKPGVKIDIANSGGPGRELHADDPEEHGADGEDPAERRQPGDRRPHGADEGRARPGRRRASSTRPTRGPCRAR